MSLFARTTLRTVRVAPVARFSTSAVAQKGPVDAAKDTLKQVDRTVSDAAVSGIETGEKLSAQAKAAAGVKTEQAKQQAGATANQAANQAQSTANQAANQAQGTAHEAAKKAEGLAQQAQKKTQ